MDAHKQVLPPLLQLELESFIVQYHYIAEPNNENPKIKPVKIVKPIMMKEKVDNLKGGISGACRDDSRRSRVNADCP